MSCLAREELNCHSQQLSSACDFKSYFCKQRGPRSDCSSRSSLIWVHTVCLCAKIGLKSLQEYSADNINRRHFQMHVFLTFWGLNMKSFFCKELLKISQRKTKPTMYYYLDLPDQWRRFLSACTSMQPDQGLRWSCAFYSLWAIQRAIASLGGSVGCTSDWWSGCCGFDPRQIGNILSWRLIMKYFLQSFSPFHWFKKGNETSSFVILGEKKEKALWYNLLLKVNLCHAE